MGKADIIIKHQQKKIEGSVEFELNVERFL